ncbi:MAG: hypothetical protein H5T69_18355, partial [Chloroflexi bacterium]|nr:hypothetical protein [Chloroflexota bacterium]
MVQMRGLTWILVSLSVAALSLLSVGCALLGDIDDILYPTNVPASPTSPPATQPVQPTVVTPEPSLPTEPAPTLTL